jgi:septation ring formation regulator EzrA
MLAQISAENLGTVIMGIAILVAIAASSLALLQTGKAQKRNIEPQPLEVAVTEKFSTRESCNQKHTETDRRMNTMEHEIATIRASIQETLLDYDRKSEERISKVHDRINALGTSISDKIGDLKRDIGRLETKS